MTMTLCNSQVLGRTTGLRSTRNTGPASVGGSVLKLRQRDLSGADRESTVQPSYTTAIHLGSAVTGW